MNVVDLRDWRRHRGGPGRKALSWPGSNETLANRAPATVEPPDSGQHRSYQDPEDRVRMRQNLAALAVVVVLVVTGGWLIDRLQTYSRTMACLEAGHRNCVPLQIEQPRPY